MQQYDYDTIYKTYKAQIQRYLSRLVGSEEAEDLTQETFIKVFNSLDTFRGESKLSTWIYKIATNIAIDKLRIPSFREKIKRRTDSSVDEEHCHATHDGKSKCSECSDKPDDIYIRREMNRCIRDFIERLPGPFKSVIILSELEGMKNIEIAEVLDCSLETVKIRLHRAKSKLKKIFETDCIFYRNKENELVCDLNSEFENIKNTL